MSRFVSSGTDQEPAERDEAWLQAQKAVEARHLAKLDAGKQADGKSLYETLQANKAAKQEAFEESIRLRNQFRSLDDDEVEFLDSIAAEARAKEAEVRRDAAVQLESFRALQQEAEKATKDTTDAVEPVTAEAWSTAGRKRKKQDVLAGIVKKRQLSSNQKSTSPVETNSTEVFEVPSKQQDSKDDNPSKEAVQASPTAPPASAKKPLLGLADYSSDED